MFTEDQMVNIENTTILIQGSVVFSKEQKNILVRILPSLNEDQQKTLIDFLQKEKKELGAIEDKYARQKADLYKNFIANLNQNLRKAQKMIVEEIEKKSQAKEGNPDDLLKQI